MSSSPSNKNNQQPKTEPIAALNVPAKTSTLYPHPYKAVVQGRAKRALGNMFGLTNFGINHTTLLPGASSALAHCHEKQDEFVYILSGTAVVTFGDSEYSMKPGECMGFPAGTGQMHCVRNNSETEPVVFLEIGDRTPGDVVHYDQADLQAVDDGSGTWKFLHKDGTPYDTTTTEDK